MTMSTQADSEQTKQTSARLAALEKQFAPKGTKGGWQAIAGKAKSDKFFREAMKLGKQWRDQANCDGL